MADWSTEFSQRFDLGEPWFSGEVETVWRAIDRETGTAVLVRRIASLPAARDGVFQRLDALGRLAHPALVNLILSERIGSGVVLVRPWLAERAEERIARAEVPERIGRLIRIAEALHAAHVADVVHGRLHAGNLLSDDRGRLRVVDFGLPGARPRNEGSWMSPQQRAGEPLSAADDIFALADLAYRWLVGTPPGPPLPVDARLEELHQRRSRGGGVPPAVAAVLAAGLAADPAHRPASMHQFREELEDARLALTRAAAIGMEESEDDWSAAARRRIPVQGPEEAIQARGDKPSLLRISTAVAGVVIAIGLVMVLWVLPARVEREEAARRAEAEAMQAMQDRLAEERAAAAAEEEPESLSEAELERLLAKRKAAEALLDEIINQRLELEARSIDRWAPQAFAATDALKVSADAPFRAQDYDQATDIYRRVLAELGALSGLGDMVFAEALERGKSAIARGRSEAAREAYGLALAIEPEDALAQAGAQRAETLDQVLALKRQAERLQAEEAWEGARDALVQVRNLDPLTEGIEAAIAGLERTIADNRFRRAMSEGLAAMGQSRWAEAREALERARSMRPGDSAPQDALIEVGRRFREATVAHHRGLAQEAAGAEQWSRALSHYQAVLEQDPNLQFAQQGRERAARRAALDERLETFIAAPSRWWSDSGRADASRLLSEARSVADPGPRLEGQLQTLATQLELARRPVEVTLVSDSACNVVVYKVARLGQFDSRRLRLTPGVYTVVGTRDGFRDVRKQFLVKAGESDPAPIEIRCEEAV